MLYVRSQKELWKREGGGVQRKEDHTTRNHDLRQPREQERIEHEMTYHCRNASEEERQVPDIHSSNMFMGDEKERKPLRFGSNRTSDEGCVQQSGPKKSTGEWKCRRLMAWLREIGLEFVDIIVK